MKLLSKSEIATAKAKDKRQEIDEGVKLAKSVDRLREVRAEEDASLQKFRGETLAKIQSEITSKTEELGGLEKEVKELEERKIEALKPLDERWEEVKGKETELTKFALDLNNKHVLSLQKEKELAIEKEELEVEKGRIANERNETIRNLTIADESREKAKRELAQIEARIEIETNNFAERDIQITLKEERLKDEEKKLLTLKKALDKKEKELAGVERRINDKYLTLQTTLKRIKDGRRI